MSNGKSRQGFFGKLAFGTGSFTQWFVNSAFNTWVFAYYYSAVRLPVHWIMLAYIIWTVYNAINDPLIGWLSDHTKTKIGRRKPYIIAAIIPIAILEVIIWLAPLGPDNVTGTPIIGTPFVMPPVTFFYLLAMLIIYDTVYTMIALPYDSLFPEMYTSVKERAQVNTIRQVLATIGLILAFLIPGIFIGDLEQPQGYFINGIVTSIIVVATLVFSVHFGVKEREEFKQDTQNQFKFFEGLKIALKNKGFVLYTVMFFLYQYILLVLSTSVPLFAKHVLLVDDTFLTSILLGIMFIVGIATVAIWKKIDVKLGGKKGYAIALVSYCVASLPLLFVDAVPGLEFSAGLIIVIFMGFGFGGMLYFIYLLIADVVDEDELESGVRREGLFFGITNFFMRLSMVLSIVTVSLVFVSTGWEEYDPRPGVDVLMGLKIIVVVFPIIAVGVSLLCLKFYPYTKEKVFSMKRRLDDLHAAKLQKVRGREGKEN